MITNKNVVNIEWRLKKDDAKMMITQIGANKLSIHGTAKSIFLHLD